MIHSEILSFSSTLYEKQVTLYREDTVPVKACILYIHGGGLLCGTREDLPETHIQTFTEQGYAILALDYPLAPAAKLPEIKADLLLSISEHLKRQEEYLGASVPYFLWGRSSGAYLALILAASQELPVPPAGIISYYGYGFLCDIWYEEPSRHYQSLPPVGDACLHAIPSEIHSVGPLDTHYSLYIHARQTGCWNQLIYEGRPKYFYLDYSLRLCDKMPAPLFCAHSTGDPDVPFAEFQALCQKYRPVKFIASSREHDFDRQEDLPETIHLLEETLAFTENCLK